MTAAAFAAGDHPVNSGEVQIWQRTEQGLQGEEPDIRWGRAQMVSAPSMGAILNRGAQPDVCEWPF